MRGHGQEASRVNGFGWGIGKMIAIRPDVVVGQIFFEVHPDHLHPKRGSRITVQLYGNVQAGLADCSEKGTLLTENELGIQTGFEEYHSMGKKKNETDNFFWWRVYPFDQYNEIFYHLNIECHPRSEGAIVAAVEYAIHDPFGRVSPWDGIWFPDDANSNEGRGQLNYCIRVQVVTPYDEEMLERKKNGFFDNITDTNATDTTQSEETDCDAIARLERNSVTRKCKKNPTIAADCSALCRLAAGYTIASQTNDSQEIAGNTTASITNNSQETAGNTTAGNTTAFQANVSQETETDCDELAEFKPERIARKCQKNETIAADCSALCILADAIQNNDDREETDCNELTSLDAETISRKCKNKPEVAIDCPWLCGDSNVVPHISALEEQTDCKEIASFDAEKIARKCQNNPEIAADCPMLCDDGSIVAQNAAPEEQIDCSVVEKVLANLDMQTIARKCQNRPDIAAACPWLCNDSGVRRRNQVRIRSTSETSDNIFVKKLTSYMGFEESPYLYDTYIDIKFRIDGDSTKENFGVRTQAGLEFDYLNRVAKMYSNQAVDTKEAHSAAKTVTITPFLCSDGESEDYGTIVDSDTMYATAQRKYAVGQRFRVCVAPDPGFEEEYRIVRFETVSCSTPASSRRIIVRGQNNDKLTQVDRKGKRFRKTYLDLVAGETVAHKASLSFSSTVVTPYIKEKDEVLSCFGVVEAEYMDYRRRRLDEDVLMTREERGAVVLDFMIDINLMLPEKAPDKVDENDRFDYDYDNEKSRNWKTTLFIAGGVVGVLLFILCCSCKILQLISKIEGPDGDTAPKMERKTIHPQRRGSGGDMAQIHPQRRASGGDMAQTHPQRRTSGGVTATNMERNTIHPQRRASGGGMATRRASSGATTTNMDRKTIHSQRMVPQRTND